MNRIRRRANCSKLSLSIWLQVFFVLFCCVAANAASVDVFGVSLKVDSVEQMSDGTLRIVVLGDERIIAESQAAAFTLGAYVDHNAAVLLSLDDLQTITRKALAAEDLKSATDSLMLLLSHPKMDSRQLEGFFDSIKTVPHFAQLLRNCILTEISEKSSLQGELAGPLLFYAALDGREWARQNGIRLVYRFFEEAKKYLRDGFVRNFSASESEGADEILDVMEIYFGGNDNDLQDLRAISQRVRAIREAFSTHNLTEVLSVMGHYSKEIRSDPVMSSIVTEIIYKQCDRLAAENAFSDVLFLLSRVDFNKRTPRAHELILQALAGLNPGNLGVLQSQDVKEMLDFYATQGDTIRLAYVKTLQLGADSLLEKTNPFEVDLMLDALKTLRPDPNKENDAIRIAQTKEYLRLGDEGSAVRKLAEVQTRIALKDRLWFGFYRLCYKTSLWVYIALFVCLACLSVCIRLVSMQRGKRKREKWRSLGWQEYEAYETVEGSRTFVMQELRSRLDPVVQEYYACLQVFGLNPGASGGEIKSAYRKKMKVIHPDLNVGEEEESAKEFIRIRKAYERLLEMEKEGVPIPFRD